MDRRRAAISRASAGRRTLPAKISVPRTSHAMARARVFGLLDRASSRGAVWIVGAAGAGKTTAVASYLAGRRRPVVWYDVDPSDSDVANLFRYLARGVRTATRSRRELPAFQVQHLAGLRAFTRRFFEAVFAALPAGGSVVFDNCHSTGDDPTWAEILEEAVLSVPAARRLLLVSRAQPPAALSRLMVNDRLAQVTGTDLRFSAREALALARARAPVGMRRNREALSKLCALADGWPAGLVLALDHAARGEPGPDLAHRGERLFNYFSAEVVSELPPETQRVLQATALLPCVTDAMATAVSGSEGGGALLADLHRRGLLVERLTTEPVSYRYHPLLRAFLLAREVPAVDLLARAAAACAESGFLDEAVDLYAGAGARDRIAALLLQNAQQLVAEGRYPTLAAWLKRLDEDALVSEPWLRFWQATSNVLLDQSASQAQFEQAFEGFRARGDAAGLYLAIAGATQVIFIESEDLRRLDPWFRRYTEIRSYGPPPPSDDIEAMALTSLLMTSSYFNPSHGAVSGWVERALALAPVDVGVRLRLSATLATCQSIVGRPDAAEDVLSSMRPAVGPAADPLTRLMVNEAELQRAYFGTWRDVLKFSERGLAIAEAEGLPLFEAAYLAACAQAFAKAGDEAAASDYLRRAAEAGTKVPSAHLFRAGLYEYTQAMVAVAGRRFDEAARCLELALALTVRTGCRWPEIIVRTLRCVALAAQERTDDAAREAALMVGEIAPIGAMSVAMELLRAETRPPPAAREREAISHLLDQAVAYGSCATFYLLGLPNA